jgi:hypothetical protein
MSFHRHVRRVALTLACCALIVPSSAAAEKIGDTPADFPGSSAYAPKIGDTPADFPPTLAVASGFGASAGDTPVDFPGASRAPQYETPRTIQVVRPERTVVRTVDAVLPIVLSSAALLLALGGVGLAIVRTRTARRSLAH